jgi:hypothetical protein
MSKTLLLISKLTVVFSKIAFLYNPHQENQFPGSDQPFTSMWAFAFNTLLKALNIILFRHHSWVR